MRGCLEKGRKPAAFEAAPAKVRSGLAEAHLRQTCCVIS